MLKNVAAVLLDGVHPFELGVVCEVFGIDRSDEGLPTYDFAVVSAEGPTLGTHAGGLTLSTPYGLERLEEADLIAVPAGNAYLTREFPPELLDALVRAVDRGARVLSVCSGVFMLGAAGLLDGRRCSVHWRHAEELARRHPRTTVEPDVLYVDEGPVITSAGTAAGIDACLHLVRKEQGPEVANKIARRMVVPPHRDGGQAQYIERPLPASSCDTVGEVLAWMERHLDFDPDRWLPERSKDIPKYAMRPFSVGNRKCPSDHFSMALLTLVTAALATSYHFEQTPGSKDGTRVGITLHPHDLRLRTTPRSRQD